MSALTPPGEPTLAAKIARLAQERGWNQEDLARIAHLNRFTVRRIMQDGDPQRMRNATILACARALGLTVNELRTLPLDRLLPRMHGVPPDDGDERLQHLAEFGTQPELKAWVERNIDRARQMSSQEIQELLGLQGSGGPLVRFGVEHFVDLIERRRKLRRQVEEVAGSEYLGLLEQIVALLHDKIQPK